MSTLTVVRHGQASFLAANYDKLSPTGELQSRLLGEYWLARGIRFDKIYSGPAERQVRTAGIIGDVFRNSGVDWPEMEILRDLDEYPAEAVVRTFLPELTAKHPHLAEAVAEFQSTTEFRVKQRLFDRVLREVSERWLQGEVSSPSIPSWQDFCHRVEAAIEKITSAASKSSQVAVFTSGGPTAATTRVALKLDYQNTLTLTWSPRNASFAEFLFSNGRFSLSTFNNTPHLTDPAHLTYR